MSKFKTGKELIQEWKIKDFELFEHVKAGLQPFDHFGKPLSPPDITDKLKSLNGSKHELDSLLRSWPQLTNEEFQKRFKSNPREMAWYYEQRQRHQPRMEKLSRDIEDLKNELMQIEDKHSWANYELPEDGKSAEWVINSLLNAFFKTETAISTKVTPLQQPSSSETQHKTKGTSTNYFKEEEGFWKIRYEAQDATIRHLVGLQYIAFLLERPGKAVSCIELAHAVNPLGHPSMTSNQAAAEGLRIGIKSQEITDAKTKKKLLEKFNQLTYECENAESELERSEIEKEQAELLKAAQQRSFRDPGKSKVQSTVQKSMDRAIESLRKRGMTALVKHLEITIKPDGAYGYVYNGNCF